MTLEPETPEITTNEELNLNKHEVQRTLGEWSIEKSQASIQLNRQTN